MGSMTKKGIKARQKIFEASVELIQKKGYEHTTLKDICNHAKVGIGTFYHYFTSKQDIIIEFINHEQEQILKELEEQHCSSPKEELKTLMKYQFEYIRYKEKEFLSAFILICIDHEQGAKVAKNYFIHNKMDSILEKGEQNGEISCVNGHAFASKILEATLLGFSTLWASLEGESFPQGLLDSELEEILKLIDILVK